MKSAFIAAALTACGLIVPAHADTRVVAGNGLTLTEAAQVKFNRDTRPDDRHVAVTPGQPSGAYGRLAASFGMTAEEAEGMSLAEVFVAKINHGASGTDQQLVKGDGVVMGTRSPYHAAGRAQLVASAGLSPAEAGSMSLTEVAAAKFARGPAND
jgi:hypothetical protein